MEQCKLCHKKAKLQESHIIPKYVYKWMKKTGTGRFRQLKVLNKPLQDGIKEFLLCDTCEKEFGKREDWFKENVFDKYLSDPNAIFKTSIELTYFAISILWRVLIYFKDDGNEYRFKNELDLAELEWMNFLFNDKPLKAFKCIHLVFISENLYIENGAENLYSYFHRSVDIEIAESNEKSFVYAKFSRFILFGVIRGISDTDFSGTNIYNLAELNPSNQTMDDADVVDFIVNRSTHIKSYKDLSINQQHQNDRYFNERLEKIKGNDYWNVLKKDTK
jgi:hypothetical protein